MIKYYEAYLRHAPEDGAVWTRYLFVAYLGSKLDIDPAIIGHTPPLTARQRTLLRTQYSNLLAYERERVWRELLAEEGCSPEERRWILLWCLHSASNFNQGIPADAPWEEMPVVRLRTYRAAYLEAFPADETARAAWAP